MRMLSILMVIPAFITATLTAFFGGILVKFGYLNIHNVFMAIIIGDFISSTIWYIIGKIGGNVFLATFGRIFGVDQQRLNSFMSIINKFKDYVAFFVSAPVGIVIMLIGLMNAGIQKYSFSKYIASSTLVSVIWVSAMLAFGYAFGYAYQVFPSIAGRILVSIMLLMVVFILLTLGAWIRTSIISRLVNHIIKSGPEKKSSNHKILTA